MLEDAAILLIEQTPRMGLPHFGPPYRVLLAPPFRRSFTLLSVRACFDVHRVTWGGVQVLFDPEIPLRGADLRMPVGERDLLNFCAVGGGIRR